MLGKENDKEIVTLTCDYCHTPLLGVKRKNKTIKGTCPMCGSKNVVEYVSERHYTVDVYLPSHIRLK